MRKQKGNRGGGGRTVHKKKTGWGVGLGRRLFTRKTEKTFITKIREAPGGGGRGQNVHHNKRIKIRYR